MSTASQQTVKYSTVLNNKLFESLYYITISSHVATMQPTIDNRKRVHSCFLLSLTLFLFLLLLPLFGSYIHSDLAEWHWTTSAATTWVFRN